MERFINFLKLASKFFFSHYHNGTVYKLSMYKPDLVILLLLAGYVKCYTGVFV